jgi:hypothetical protein
MAKANPTLPVVMVWNRTISTEAHPQGRLIEEGLAFVRYRYAAEPGDPRIRCRVQFLHDWEQDGDAAPTYVRYVEPTEFHGQPTRPTA